MTIQGCQSNVRVTTALGTNPPLLRLSTTPIPSLPNFQWQPTFIITLRQLAHNRFARSACTYSCSTLLIFFSDRANRKLRDADPANWIPKKYQYSEKTLNPNFRVHIENFHLAQFKLLAKERNWKVQLKGLKSQSQSQAASEASMPVGQPEKFDESTFQRYLSNFIIVDDQVCPRLMLVAMLTFYVVYQRCGLF